MNDAIFSIRENIEQATRIKRDITAKTGIHVVHVQQFHNANRDVADLVLPILAAWVRQIPSGDVRGDLYVPFRSPQASAYIDSMLQWLLDEHHAIALDSLKSAIYVAMRKKDAAKVWAALRSAQPSYFDYRIMVKLAKIPSVASEVRDALLEIVQSDDLDPAAYYEIGKVDDDRIVSAIYAKADHPDPEVRRAVRRLKARLSPLPGSLRKPALKADPRIGRTCLYSTEVDSEQLHLVIQSLRKRFGFALPVDLHDLSFLDSLPLDRWVWTPASSDTDQDAEFWFRLEEPGVVEVLLVTGGPGPKGADRLAGVP